MGGRPNLTPPRLEDLPPARVRTPDDYHGVEGVVVTAAFFRRIPTWPGYGPSNAAPGQAWLEPYEGPARLAPHTLVVYSDHPVPNCRYLYRLYVAEWLIGDALQQALDGMIETTTIDWSQT